MVEVCVVGEQHPAEPLGPYWQTVYAVSLSEFAAVPRVGEWIQHGRMTLGVVSEVYWADGRPFVFVDVAQFLEDDGDQSALLAADWAVCTCPFVWSRER